MPKRLAQSARQLRFSPGHQPGMLLRRGNVPRGHTAPLASRASRFELECRRARPAFRNLEEFPADRADSFQGRREPQRLRVQAGHTPRGRRDAAGGWGEELSRQSGLEAPAAVARARGRSAARLKAVTRRRGEPRPDAGAGATRPEGHGRMERTDEPREPPQVQAAARAARDAPPARRAARGRWESKR